VRVELPPLLVEAGDGIERVAADALGDALGRVEVEDGGAARLDLGARRTTKAGRFWFSVPSA
jgi:hypothetical protein